MASKVILFDMGELSKLYWPHSEASRSKEPHKCRNVVADVRVYGLTHAHDVMRVEESSEQNETVDQLMCTSAGSRTRMCQCVPLNAMSSSL
ncbi:hypothetical protein NDU88_004736 [Pleurodeles waltl]|uniref:Uncharacterized protein n=1 Tax=Pleurodeles waltl TaxID=8319 RepID=A0AAV7RJK3_PLEWA|nr:hypothetical protein NDU88_004736 [Pleurodeles waltl]